MRSMLVAELAEFLQLNAVWVIALVLCRRVVALFAARASHRNNYPHVVHLLKTPYCDKKRRNYSLTNTDTPSCPMTGSFRSRKLNKPSLLSNTYAYLGLPKTLYHKGQLKSMKR